MGIAAVILPTVFKHKAMNLGLLDIVCLVGYMGGIGLMGVLIAKRNVTTEDYFVGGRSHKGWVIGLSLVGTSISSISFRMRNRTSDSW